MNTLPRPAPQWQIERWFNTPTPLTLESLRGKVIVLEAFQMLCPGCVSHGLPQAQRIAATFPRDQVAVIGLHSVFEHHQAMTPVSLQAFLHEYRIGFPVAVDQPDEHGPVPKTMASYQLRGTPTLTIIDAEGVIRHQHFGQVGDLVVGAQIAELVAESRYRKETPDGTEKSSASDCSDGACAIPVA